MFVDRDGTINVKAAEHDYIRDPRDFQWLAGALEGLVTLAHSALPLIVVSNQRGVARGLVEESALSAIEHRIQAALGRHGVRIAAFRYCLHDLDANCECRKPRPGLLLSAAREMHLDLASSWMIGDTETDMQAGRAAGCRTILITADASMHPRTAASLREAAAIVLGPGGERASLPRRSFGPDTR